MEAIRRHAAAEDALASRRDATSRRRRCLRDTAMLPMSSASGYVASSERARLHRGAGAMRAKQRRERIRCCRGAGARLRVRLMRYGMSAHVMRRSGDVMPPCALPDAMLRLLLGAAPCALRSQHTPPYLSAAGDAIAYATYACFVMLFFIFSRRATRYHYATATDYCHAEG